MNVIKEWIDNTQLNNEKIIETINTGGGCMVDFYYDPKEEIAVLINEEICNIVKVYYDSLKHEVYDECIEKITEAWGCTPNLEEKEDVAYLILDTLAECQNLESIELIETVSMDKTHYDCGDMAEEDKLKIIQNLIKINKK